LEDWFAEVSNASVHHILSYRDIRPHLSLPAVQVSKPIGGEWRKRLAEKRALKNAASIFFGEKLKSRVAR